MTMTTGTHTVYGKIAGFDIVRQHENRINAIKHLKSLARAANKLAAADPSLNRIWHTERLFEVDEKKGRVIDNRTGLSVLSIHISWPGVKDRFHAERIAA